MARLLANDNPLDNYGDNSQKFKVLTTVASFYLAKATKETDEKMRKELFTDVIRYLTKSEKIKLTDKSTFALKGFLFFFQNDSKLSATYFDNAKEVGPNFMPCVLGRACLEFAKKKYSEARDLFKAALKQNPQGPIQMRVGLSICYFQLDELDLAKIGFQSVLAREPKCVEAIIGLAVIAKRQGQLQAYYSRLEEIHRLEPSNYLLCAYLAEHYFYKGDFAKTKKLIAVSIKTIEANVLVSRPDKKTAPIRLDMLTIKSKFYYMLGFIAHEEDKLQVAFKYYKQAVDANPENFTALFGLGQLHLANKNYQDSLLSFESIVQARSENECSDCFRIMAYLYSKLGKKPQAKTNYELALKYHPHDVELLIEFAIFMESLDIKESLTIYTKIDKLLNSNPTIKVKPQFYNNYAATLIKNKRLDEAEACLARAFETEGIDQDPALSFFLKFNRGILHEEKGRFSEAVEEYKALVQTNPLFQDAVLRLAYIFHKKGELGTAVDLCDLAVRCAESSKLFKVDTPICMKASIQLEDNELEKCEATVKPLAKLNSDTDDPYAILIRARCAYNRSVALRSEPSEQKKLLKEVAECGHKILTKKEEENNMYAGMVIAAIFGERARFKDCTDILSTCQEAHPNNPKVLYNLALVEYFKENFDKSLTILVSHRQKHQEGFNESVEILFAINNLLLKEYQEAAKQFKKMVMMYPHMHGYVYNLAAYMHEYLKNLFKLSKRDSVQIETATRYIKSAQKIFKSLDKNIAKKGENTLSYPDSWSEFKKKRVQVAINTLRVGLNQNKFFLFENIENYQEILRKDKSRIDEEMITIEERRRINEAQFMSRKQLEDMEREKKREEELKRERMAEIDRRIAEQMTEALRLSALQQEQKKVKPTKQKASKIIEDVDGSMPLLNFGEGADDYEQTFNAKQQIARVNPPRKTKPKKAEQKEAQPGEKKRLKKRLVVEKDDSDSDQLLDIDPVYEEEDEDEDDDNKKRTSNGEDMGKNVQPVNFTGQDDTENTL